MTVLGSVPSTLGRISLHVKRGRFETRHTWTDTAGKTRRTKVRQAPDHAFDWYLLCQRDGIVVRDFPLDGER